MEGTNISGNEVVVIRDLDELQRAFDEQFLELTEADICIDLYIEHRGYSRQLLARLGDGRVMDPVPYIERYLSEAEEEHRDIPAEVKMAILVQAPALYNHYGSEHAKNLIERLS